MTSSRSGDDRTRILIAEDDRDFLDALEFWLSDYDAETTTVTDGRAALEAIDASFDLFLCDQRMPQLTGPEVIERMDREGYDVPTIVISAYEPNYHGHEAVVDRYLSKPIDKKQLHEAIDQLLAV